MRSVGGASYERSCLEAWTARTCEVSIAAETLSRLKCCPADSFAHGGVSAWRAERLDTSCGILCSVCSSTGGHSQLEALIECVCERQMLVWCIGAVQFMGLVVAG